jgi:hypothetical protein
MPHSKDESRTKLVFEMYDDATIKDLQALAILQEILGDPRHRVEVAQDRSDETDAHPLPASYRYEMG